MNFIEDICCSKMDTDHKEFDTTDSLDGASFVGRQAGSHPILDIALINTSLILNSWLPSSFPLNGHVLWEWLKASVELMKTDLFTLLLTKLTEMFS